MPQATNKSNGFDNQQFLNSMPPQAIHSSRKTAKWAKFTIDAIDAFGSASLTEGKTSRENKKINYDLVNNIFDPAEEIELIAKPIMK